MTRLVRLALCCSLFAAFASPLDAEIKTQKLARRKTVAR